MRRAFAAFLTVLLLLGTASVAEAQDGLLSAIEEYLKDVDESLEDEYLLFGKVQIVPFVAQRVIYDDNIYLNDEDEPETSGRESDVISDTTLRVGFVLPVNNKTSKFYQQIFGRSRITLLSVEGRFLQYMENQDSESINTIVRSDLFGVLTDLTSIETRAGKITGELSVEYSDLSDPIDILVRDLGSAGFPVVPGGDLDEIRRRSVDAHGAVGYLGNHFDGKIGYEFYWLDFADDLFRQADMTSHAVYVEAGIEPPGMNDKRVFARVRYEDIHFREELLNDARVLDGILGLEGQLTRRVRFLVQGGVRDWDAQDTGELGEDTDYFGGIALVRLAFVPPVGDGDLKLQLEGRREVEWSAISNFRVDHYVIFSTSYDFTRRFSGDITLAWSHHVPSTGPIRTLYEGGVGVQYKLIEHVRLTARYLHRLQEGSREIAITTAGAFESDSDFQQNVVSVGIEIGF